MSVPDECYSSNASYSLDYISTFAFESRAYLQAVEVQKSVTSQARRLIPRSTLKGHCVHTQVYILFILQVVDFSSPKVLSAQ